MLKAKYYTELSEIDKMVFEKLVSSGHYLRRVKEAIDFEQLREIMKDCYSPVMGRSAEDPVMMLKLGFLQFHYNLSDREVIAEAGVNIAFRYFLDLSIESQLPVPSLLSQFRSRLGEQRYKQIFEAVVGQARLQGLVKDRLRLKDATHVIANIAIPFTIELVAATREKLFNRAQRYAPEQVERHKAKAAQIRAATSDLKDPERLLHRVEHLREIVEWAEALEQKLESSGREELDEALSAARKVLTDTEEGQADKMRSLVDPDARRGKHGSYYDGYMLDILVDPDSELVTALDVLPANADEAGNAEKLLESEEKAHGNDIAELSIDKIGFNGEVLHTLADPEGLAVTVYVPPFEHSHKSKGFKPRDFLLDETKQILTCPAGKQSSVAYRSSNGRVFHFSGLQCADCPLIKDCMPNLPKTGARKVEKNLYEADYQAARQRAETERYAEVKKLHHRVERKFADMVCNHSGRRARYRGIKKVRLQFFLTAMAVNIKRMVKLLSNKLSRTSLLFFCFFRSCFFGLFGSAFLVLFSSQLCRSLETVFPNLARQETF
jgi:transposase